ncbi:MAG TPA: hypothetical protein VGN04_08530 [Herbaspirillum sp.]|jgi:hypothetical protein
MQIDSFIRAPLFSATAKYRMHRAPVPTPMEDPIPGQVPGNDPVPHQDPTVIEDPIPHQVPTPPPVIDPPAQLSA